MKKINYLFFSFLIPGLFSCDQKEKDESKKRNVLFIAIDDLRPQLNCYGKTQIHSPNIDQLASESLVFEMAHCQQAVSAPSRNGLMTGLRADSLGIYDLGTFFRENVPNVVTMPQHFKNKGYQSEGMGKILHKGHGNQEDPLSWSRDFYTGGEDFDAEPIQRGDTTGLHGSFPRIDGKKLTHYATTVPDENLIDNRILNHALERLEVLQDTNFFMAVGFKKPHLPFVAPKRYFDMYDTSNIEVPEKVVPESHPPFSHTNFGELRKYHDIPPKGPLSDKRSKELIRGYYATVSYVDDLVGRLLDKLGELGLEENTLVVLWGDHGWTLGEYGKWCKHSNYEYDTRIPLMLKVPGKTSGERTDALVESLDIYPTLCDLTGLEKPSHLQGETMVPLLDDPEQNIKNAAWSQYPRGHQGMRLMGYAMRTQHYRYVRWVEKNNPENVVARELYDHRDDPGETDNLAVKPGNESLVNKMDSLFKVEYKNAHGNPLTAQ